MSCYVLGVGNIGCLIAHALRSSSSAPSVNLLFHRLPLLNDFVKLGGIVIKRNNIVSKQEGFGYELMESSLAELLPTDHLPKTKHFNNQCLDSRSVIRHLIVATKVNHVESAIEKVKHRLRPDSSIVLVHNGMGCIEALQEKVFPDEERRPNIIVAVIDHGCYKVSNLIIQHVGFGSIFLGVVPRTRTKSSGSSVSKEGTQYEKSVREIIGYFTSAAILNASMRPYRSILNLQLQKLIANAAINPLTTLFECENGQLLRSSSLEQLMLDLAFEAHRVISHSDVGRSMNTKLWDTENTVRFLKNVILKTERNKSSMLQDRMALRSTEIDYVNGYIEQLGIRVGIHTPYNSQIIKLVKAALALDRRKYGAKLY